MPLEPCKKLQVTVMQAPPHHQAVPARNTQNERLPNPALRALILHVQDVLEDWLLIVKILVVIGSVDGIHFSPLCFHCSYRPDLVPCVCALSFRPDWDSQSSTIISMPLTSCVGGCLCYSGEEPALPVSVVGFILKMSSQVHHQRSTPTRVIIKPISTSSINQPPKANKITSSSATLFHNPKRQNLTPTSPVTLTIMVKFTQTSSRQD
ncbi:hypothetical protein DY000_02004345 [Brassica cretica]|uniref:Uncharacterized protein n=1 Tax=Brassica cretica TaxID=69181 RepID=A0ABQ7BX61_BRACR|nr:hypothetical protein DY000_02004345 [Brassica cretica]